MPVNGTPSVTQNAADSDLPFANELCCVSELCHGMRRWFTPRGCTSKHFNPRMKSVMMQLEAIDIPAGSVTLPQPSVPTQTVVSEAGGRGSNADSASTRQLAGVTAVPQGAAAVGWGLSIYSQAEEVWVRGEVISWNSRQGQYHVLYEDGEDEWLKLAKENVQWHSSRSTISETAGLQKGKLDMIFIVPNLHPSCSVPDVILHNSTLQQCFASCTSKPHPAEGAPSCLCQAHARYMRA